MPRKVSRELENDRFRYCDDLDPARAPGAMIGRRVVREWPFMT
jgi:hypothetical protein